MTTRWMVLGLVAVALFVSGCDRAPAAPPGRDEASLLAKADAADGTVDKVVVRCVVCNLSMDGEPERTSTYAGYTFHLCSAGCKETFDHDPAKALGRLS